MRGFPVELHFFTIELGIHSFDTLFYVQGGHALFDERILVTANEIDLFRERIGTHLQIHMTGYVIRNCAEAGVLAAKGNNVLEVI